MLTNPEQNIKVTELDEIRIKKVESRLDNVISEIDIHRKTLTALVIDCENKEKEKEYLSKQVDELSILHDRLNREIPILKQTLQETQDTLDTTEIRNKKLSDFITTKEQELQEREKAIQRLEKEMVEKLSEIKKELSNIEEHKTRVQKNKDILNKAFEQIHL